MNQTTDTDSPPRVIRRRREARQAVRQLQAAGKRVGLVPTMGALHQGHLSLVDASVAQCDATVVTIFVNPTQFAPGEDLQQYPRQLEQDLALLASRRPAFVFAPDEREMYPEGDETTVDVGSVAAPLEGVRRPTHFRGVATVVLKLFLALPADVAFFGQKDYQQTLVIRRLVADLDLPIEIRVCPIVREADGLALSSRNAYLSADQRGQALALNEGLRQAETLVAEGCREAAQIRRHVREHLQSRNVEVEYVSLVREHTVDEIERIAGPSVVLVAARVGRTRLIDNCVVLPPPS